MPLPAKKKREVNRLYGFSNCEGVSVNPTSSLTHNQPVLETDQQINGHTERQKMEGKKNNR